MKTAAAGHRGVGPAGRWLGIGVLLAAGVGIALLVNHYAPLLSPTAQVNVPLDPACDLTETACSSRVPGGGEVKLSLTPRPIPVMEEIRIEVQIEDIQAESVEVDFAGVDMNMGFNRYHLTRTEGEGGGFRGIGVLPICIRDRMAWEATVMIQSDDGLIAAPFRFETVRSQ
ncbi:hypothetical protein [Thiohalomonas denitrificans]|uniref:Uncharacterized protein n=1 Tax=Thiohalomonas denitrificans TaxID=415747 RepID=A0A1G5QSP8_9GAMM|nr:hypothetical protein [Thiohalomonas denitrificans]SCZ64598.1 hypothetical protein SAMN03097708_02666 [Thiohalomonas denitrificans]